MRKDAEAGKEEVVRICMDKAIPHGESLLLHVWEKLHAFPHIFEVAEATGSLMEYSLSGQRLAGTKTTLKHITYGRWKVHLADFGLATSERHNE